MEIREEDQELVQKRQDLIKHPAPKVETQVEEREESQSKEIREQECILQGRSRLQHHVHQRLVQQERQGQQERIIHRHHRQGQVEVLLHDHRLLQGRQVQEDQRLHPNLRHLQSHQCLQDLAEADKIEKSHIFVGLFSFTFICREEKTVEMLSADIQFTFVKRIGMIAIKQLTQNEVLIVNQLAREIWPKVYDYMISKEQIDYMIDWMYDTNTLMEQAMTGHLFYIITVDGQPKGFMGIEPNYPDSGTLRLHKLYVHPESQGMGLGQQLLDYAEKIANELDLASINLNVNRANKAVAFYQKNGFEIIKEEDLNIGKGFVMDDYVMGKVVG